MLKPISGTWFEFHHHNVAEGTPWNEACKNFTAEQWEEKISEIASLGMKYMVMMCTTLTTETDAEAYFDTDIAPKADMKCENPMDVMFEAADKYNLNIFVSCGFYGDWTKPWINMTSPEVDKKAFKAIKQLYEKYGHHKSFYGWYYPDERGLNPNLNDDFIAYVNRYAEYIRAIDPAKKILAAPYGLFSMVVDDEYISRLKRFDVDFIAYQDGIGVEYVKLEESAGYFKQLKAAHDAAGRSKLWADIELFGFTGEIYKSALIPASWERIQKQIEAVSPYVEEILCYQYQGMLNKPGTGAYCGSDGSEELYNAIKAHNEKYL